MKLSSDQVKHVARLANLPLTEKEIEKYSEQHSAILDYVDLLNKVDTQDVEPTFNTTKRKNVTHPDNPSTGLTQKESLSNSHQNKKGFFVTKGIFENE